MTAAGESEFQELSCSWAAASTFTIASVFVPVFMTEVPALLIWAARVLRSAAFSWSIFVNLFTGRANLDSSLEVRALLLANSSCVKVKSFSGGLEAAGGGAAGLFRSASGFRSTQVRPRNGRSVQMPACMPSTRHGAPGRRHSPVRASGRHTGRLSSATTQRPGSPIRRQGRPGWHRNASTSESMELGTQMENGSSGRASMHMPGMPSMVHVLLPLHFRAGGRPSL
mmetsp:Transcript_54183/g.90293  ORF Transcript_54183/g.90293 Transcript_54183/m.90293 type:complete len:226 (-) Transcript_54183:2773-3450(-)